MHLSTRLRLANYLISKDMSAVKFESFTFGGMHGQRAVQHFVQSYLPDAEWKRWSALDGGVLYSFLRGFYRAAKEHATKEIERGPGIQKTAKEARDLAEQILLPEVGEKAMIRTPKAIRRATRHVSKLPKNCAVSYSATWSHNVISGFASGKLGCRQARFQKVIAGENSAKVRHQLEPLGLKSSELAISQIEVMKNGTASHLKHIMLTFPECVVFIYLLFKSYIRNMILRRSWWSRFVRTMLLEALPTWR